MPAGGDTGQRALYPRFYSDVVEIGFSASHRQPDQDYGAGDVQFGSGYRGFQGAFEGFLGANKGEWKIKARKFCVTG